jgi:hypothetical protein
VSRHLHISITSRLRCQGTIFTCASCCQTPRTAVTIAACRFAFWDGAMLPLGLGISLIIVSLLHRVKLRVRVWVWDLQYLI